MATFSVFWKSFVKKPVVRPVTWVCGTEQILIDDVLAIIRRVVAPAAWNYVPLSVGEDSERDVWAEVFAYPQGPHQSRLVVVRGAERLVEPERILAFLKRADAHPLTYLVLVSGDASVPHQAPTEEQQRRGLKGDVVGYLKSLSGKGHVVECRPFTQDTVKVAVDWVVAKTGMRETVAAYLLNRANGNMRLVRDVCVKLSVFGSEATISAINELLSEQPRDTFVDALVAMDKKGALAALERLPSSEFSRTLGLLDSQLDLAGMVHDMTAAHATSYEIARKAGNKNFLVKDLLTVSRHYDPARRASIRQTLCTADEALRAGVKVGVFEAVTAMW